MEKEATLVRCLPIDGGGVTVFDTSEPWLLIAHWRGSDAYSGAIEALVLDKLSKDGYTVLDQKGKWLAGPGIPADVA